MHYIFWFFLAIILSLICLGVTYVAYIVRHSGKDSRKKRTKVRICCVLGSGGHTTEMCHILETLSPQYEEKVFIIADTDRMSEFKLNEVMKDRGPYTVKRIPRSREVGQSYISSIFTTLYAIGCSIKVSWEAKPDLLLTNGPGTAIPICFSVALFDMFRLRDTTIVFIESFCRVKTLSLTGAILYFSGLADDIIVQWNDLKGKYPRVLHIDEL